MEIMQGYAPAPATPLSEEEKLKAMKKIFGDEFAQTFRDPVAFSRRRFWTQSANQFFKRDFDLISRTLHLSTVYERRRDFSPVVLEHFWNLSSRKIADIERALGMTRDRLVELCKQSQLAQSDQCDFLHPSDHVVPVIAPAARSYVNVLSILDQICYLTGTTFLAGVIDRQQKSKAEMDSKKAVRAYSAMLRSESIRLFKEAKRVTDAARLGDGASVEDQSVETAERAHNEAAAQFDQQVQKDQQADPNLHVDGDSAADLISDIVTTTTANAAAASKRAPRAKKPAGEAAPVAAAGS